MVIVRCHPGKHARVCLQRGHRHQRVHRQWLDVNTTCKRKDPSRRLRHQPQARHRRRPIGRKQVADWRVSDSARVGVTKIARGLPPLIRVGRGI